MKRKIIALVLFAFVCSWAAQAKEYNFIKANDERYAYVGRISFANPERPTWDYPGAQIHCVFNGTSVRMLTKANSGYFMIELDNQEPFKVESTPTDSLVLIAENLADNQHRLTITYCMEGLLRHPAFYGLYLDANRTLEQKPKLPTRRIEFIGNSITCGYGIEGDGSEKKFSYSQENAYMTYGARTARALNAQWQLVSRSGIGVYRNSNGNVNGDKSVMPVYYPYTLFKKSGELWDFSRYQPDVVCINLGTNDTTLPSYDVELMTKAFCQFLQAVRGHYPDAKIVLLTGTMLKAGSKRLQDLKQAEDEAVADAKKRGDNEVYRFDFTPADGSLGWGTHRHPSMRQHEQMATELTAYLQRLMNW